MLKKYFSKITLFTVLAGFAVVAFIIVVISHQPQIIKRPSLYHLAIAALAFVGIDVLLKQVLKLRNVWLWILQILLLLIAVYVWIIS